MRNRLIGVIVTAATILSTAGAVCAQQLERPERMLDRPDLNGIWQAMNTANWNLEGHSAEALDDFWQLGAIGAIPAGQSVVREGTIPYLPEALAIRDENRAAWPAEDPEAKCYMLGVPRVTYHDLPFQIFQGNGDLLMVYPFAAANRVIYMSDDSELPIDSWMGKSNGTWEDDVPGRDNDGFQRPDLVGPRRQSSQQSVDGHRALHASRAEPHLV